jgi:hypothetical protein
VKIPYQTIQASHIGSLAAEYLKENGDYLVKGNTSKGVFLENSKGNLIFLSYEASKGPYTINIPPTVQEALAACEPGLSIFHWMEGNLNFDFCGLRIAINLTNVWLPEAYAQNSTKSPDTLAIVGWALAHSKQETLLYKTARIIKYSPHNLTSMLELDGKLLQLQSSLQMMNRKEFLDAAYFWIGRGAGLTPSGDDLLTGISLAISRYRKFWKGVDEYSKWMDAIYPVMVKKTTKLAQALFAASLQGWADERLIASFDAIMDNLPLEEVIQPVSTWGSSSGFDTLAGALLVMHSLDYI